MAKDWAFVDRFTSDKPFELPADAFPPPEWIDTVPVSKADYVRLTDPAVWLTHKGVTRCYPWWIADNYHMMNDVLEGDPVWVAF